ncbi:MAG: diguanylate cyclase [Dokdonella sp.]
MIRIAPSTQHHISQRSRHFTHRVTALFVLLAAVLIALAIQVNKAVNDFFDETAMVTQTLLIKHEISMTVTALRDAEADQRSYLLSGSPERLSDHYRALPRLHSHLARLKELLQDASTHETTLPALEELLGKRLDGISLTLDEYLKSGLDGARNALPMSQSRAQDREIDAIATRMQELESAGLNARQQRSGAIAKQTRMLTLTVVGLSIAMLFAAWLRILGEQRRRLVSESRMRDSYIDLATSLEESQRLSLTLRQLSDLGEMLQGCRSVEEAIEGLSSSLDQLLPNCSGSLNLIRTSQNLVEEVVRWGSASTTDDLFFTPDECWALRRGRPHPPPETSAPLACKHIQHDASELEQLCVPMLAQGEILGVLTLSAPAITNSTREVAFAAAEQISLAIANLRLQETLRRQSLRDPLTGLFNRRYLEASLEREVLRANRRQLGMAVLMLDIDHFKRFNDTHGHEAGDALLAQFGPLLSGMIRSEDVACRYGGEEFTVVMQQVDAVQAMARAEAICAAVRTLAVQHRGITLEHISVSIGIALLPDHGSTTAELMRSADTALYAAKHAGRDRVCMAMANTGKRVTAIRRLAGSAASDPGDNPSVITGI